MEEKKTEVPTIDMPISERKKTQFVRDQQSLQIQARQEKNLTDGRRGEPFKHDLSRDEILAKAKAAKPRNIRKALLAAEKEAQ